VGKEDNITFTNRLDTDIVFSFRRVRDEGFNNERLEDTRDLFNL
jgi:hypothetical protein